MSVVVTGATGPFGRTVVESLLSRGVPAGEIVATGRRVEALADLAERGVVVRRADFDDPASLAEAFAGADKLLLVSGSEVGRRIPQHSAVIDAAKAAGVSLLAYTSIAGASTSTMLLAADHKGTEEVLAASGVPHVLLRNGWYLENYLPQLPTYLEHGVAGSAGDGRISAALRAEYAEAAAAVLVADDQAGKVYELGGPAFTLTELAAAVSSASGTPVSYTDLPVDQFAAVLAGAGLPEGFAVVLADCDRGIAAGELYVAGDDLERLLGRVPTSVQDAVASALAPAAVA